MRNSPTESFFEIEDVKRLVSKWAVDCGGKVAAKRKERGFDRRQLASLVGTTEATVLRVEAGQINPRDHMKLAIAASLAVDVEELWPFPRWQTVFASAAADNGQVA